MATLAKLPDDLQDLWEQGALTHQQAHRALDSALMFGAELSLEDLAALTALECQSEISEVLWLHSLEPHEMHAAN